MSLAKTSLVSLLCIVCIAATTESIELWPHGWPTLFNHEMKPRAAFAKDPTVHGRDELTRLKEGKRLASERLCSFSGLGRSSFPSTGKNDMLYYEMKPSPDFYCSPSKYSEQKPFSQAMSNYKMFPTMRQSKPAIEPNEDKTDDKQGSAKQDLFLGPRPESCPDQCCCEEDVYYLAEKAMKNKCRCIDDLKRELCKCKFERSENKLLSPFEESYLKRRDVEPKKMIDEELRPLLKKREYVDELSEKKFKSPEQLYAFTEKMYSKTSSPKDDGKESPKYAPVDVSEKSFAKKSRAPEQYEAGEDANPYQKNTRVPDTKCSMKVRLEGGHPFPEEMKYAMKMRQHEEYEFEPPKPYQLKPRPTSDYDGAKMRARDDYEDKVYEMKARPRKEESDEEYKRIANAKTKLADTVLDECKRSTKQTVSPRSALASDQGDNLEMDRPLDANTNSVYNVYIDPNYRCPRCSMTGGKIYYDRRNEDYCAICSTCGLESKEGRCVRDGRCLLPEPTFYPNPLYCSYKNFKDHLAEKVMSSRLRVDWSKMWTFAKRLVKNFFLIPGPRRAKGTNRKSARANGFLSSQIFPPVPHQSAHPNRRLQQNFRRQDLVPGSYVDLVMNQLLRRKHPGT